MNRVNQNNHRLLQSFVVLLFMLFLSFGYAQDNLIIKNVNLITMNSDSILYNHSVVIKGKRIHEIFTGKIPKEIKHYKQIDGKGKYLIPGLFDMHMHFVSDDRIDSKYLMTESFIPLAYGVTSVRVMIGKPEHLQLRKKIEKRKVLAPKLHIASPQLTGASFSKILNGSVVKNYKDAYQAVIDYKKEGYDFIKLTFDLNKDAYQGVIDASTKVGIQIIGHVSRKIKLEKSLESNQHVEHLDQYLDAIISEKSPTKTGLSAFGIFQKKPWETVNYIDSLKLESIITKTIENNVWNTPTNFLFVSSFATGRTDNELENSPEWGWFSNEVRNELLKYRKSYWESPPKKEFRDKYIKIRGYIIRELFRRSGKILAGSDAPEWFNMYGIGLHRELQSLVNHAGLTPYEALQTATVKPAEYLELLDYAKIQPGFVADLILLNKNPLKDIKNTTSIEKVFYNGRVLDKRVLNERLKKSTKSLKKASPLD